MKIEEIIGNLIGKMDEMKKNQENDYFVVEIENLGIKKKNLVVENLIRIIFGVIIGWVKDGGWYYENVEYWILKVMKMELKKVGVIERIVRGEKIEEIRENKVRKEREYGMKQRVVVGINEMREEMIKEV